MLLWYFLLLSNSSANSNSTLQFSFRHEFGWTIETENWFMGLHGNSWTFIENVERYQQTARNIHVLYRTNIARGILDLHHVNPRSNETNKKQTNTHTKKESKPGGPNGPWAQNLAQPDFSVKKKQTKFVLSHSVFLSFKSFKESHYYGAVAHPDLKCYLRPFLVWWVCP